jgi:hypothetical protein
MRDNEWTPLLPLFLSDDFSTKKKKNGRNKECSESEQWRKRNSGGKMLSIHRKQLLKVAKGGVGVVPRVNNVKSLPSYYGPIAMISVAITAEHHHQGRMAECQAYVQATHEDNELRRKLAMEETRKILELEAARAKRGLLENISKVSLLLSLSLSLRMLCFFILLFETYRYEFYN